MNTQRSIRISLAAIAAAGMLFAGCAKKEPEAAPAPAAEPEPTVTAPATPEVAKPSTNSVYFAFDSSELDASARATLDAHAAWLNANPDVSIRIEGNCDERGSREYNLALGQRRADAVRDYLASQGVSVDRIDTVSFGEERPVCKGAGEACWAQNRRADIVTR
ncbi:MAG: peptidoglycan-associated lipoprotein Pal [Mariprofundaceae bacterium]